MSDLVVDSRGPAAILTLNRPAKRNAVTEAMWRMIGEIAERVSADPATRALILTGAGAHFCAGADIGEFERVFATAGSTRAYNALVQTALTRLKTCAKPVLAAIEGSCFGGGVSLATQCDLRFAGREAVFAVTPARLGLVYGYRDTAGLVAAIGPGRTKDLLFTGRRLTAGEAATFGLVDRLVDSGGALDAAERFVASLEGSSGASIAGSKRLVDRLVEADGAAEALFAELTDAAAAGGDFAEGRAAFLEGRKPRFA